MKITPALTIDTILAACERDDNTGFCVECAEEHDSCEPDMRNGKCESCGQYTVYGAEELLFYVVT